MQSRDPGDGVVIAIGRIAAALAEALGAGARPVNLAGLDAEVGLVCARTLALPKDQAQACLPALTALLGRVETVRDAMLRNRPPD